MSNLFPKIKKVGIYILVFIGVITVLVYAVRFISSDRTYGDYKASYPGSQAEFLGEMALKAPPASQGFSLSEFLGISSRSKKEAPQSGSQPVQEGELTQRKVIKNGSLSLLVKSAEETAQDIRLLAIKFGGFVQESRIYEVSVGVKSGTVTIRVLADHFDETMSEIKKLALKVEREDINARDVTEQFVDLEAQLKNLRAEETQYLEIMKQARTVEDTLKVANRLSDVRGRIERIQGQLQYLSRQVDMSTIAVSLTAEAEVEVFGIRWRPLYVIKRSFRNMLSGLTGSVDAIIAFIFRLPVIILWLATIVILAAVVWRLFRWIREKLFSIKSRVE